MARSRVRRRDGVPASHRRSPSRCAQRRPVGAHRDLHGDGLQHRLPILNRVCRSSARRDCALRLGRGLSRCDWRAAGCPAALDAVLVAGSVRSARVRRYRSHPGTRLRAVRRHRVDWQEQLRHQPTARIVDLSRRDHLQSAARGRRAGAGPVRHLHLVS